MQVSEETDYKNTRLKITYYEATDQKTEIKTDHITIIDIKVNHSEAKKTYAEFMEVKDALTEKMEKTYGDFVVTDKTAQDILADYGPNGFIFEHVTAGYFGFAGAKVAEAETESGKQALDLVEYCMNRFKTTGGFIPVSRIRFRAYEAESGGRRCAQFTAGAFHMSIKELYRVFVGEI